MSYRFAVLVHLVGVLLFFGNLTVAYALMLGTARAANPAVTSHAYRLLHRVDIWLTPISVALILGGGLLAARIGQVPLAQPWITRPLAAFGVSGLVFVAVVLPAQRALVRGGWDPHRHEVLRRRWLLGATAATAAAFAATALMVLGPS